jgi:peptidoglycan/xylan/chitin deacetylase (PgdA/CDA1 family)
MTMEHQRVIALSFHEVVADRTNGSDSPLSRLQLRAGELERLLSELRHLGYQTVSSRAFRAWQQGSRTLPERAVALTFDDGYASHFDVVTSLLLRYRFSGTFFVTVDRIGQPGYMTWDQLQKLVFLGMEIGARGPSLHTLDVPSREALYRELAGPKRALEQRLGIPVRALAAPSGSWNTAVAEAAEAAGYDAVWASTVGTNGRETNPQALRRVIARQPFSAARLVAMVEGWQPSFWWAANQQLLIRLLKRVLGVYWYERLKRRLVPDA